jgi:hypothetical protein
MEDRRKIPEWKQLGAEEVKEVVYRIRERLRQMEHLQNYTTDWEKMFKNCNAQGKSTLRFHEFRSFIRRELVLGRSAISEQELMYFMDYVSNAVNRPHHHVREVSIDQFVDFLAADTSLADMSAIAPHTLTAQIDMEQREKGLQSEPDPEDSNVSAEGMQIARSYLMERYTRSIRSTVASDIANLYNC